MIHMSARIHPLCLCPSAVHTWQAKYREQRELLRQLMIVEQEIGKELDGIKATAADMESRLKQKCVVLDTRATLLRCLSLYMSLPGFLPLP